MSDSDTASAAENASSNRSTAINRRTARNQNLATIASIESNFTGKNKKVAIIGKIHEKGVSFERFMEDIRDYVATEYDEADDLELLLETQVGDFD